MKIKISRRAACGILLLSMLVVGGFFAHRATRQAESIYQLQKCGVRVEFSYNSLPAPLLRWFGNVKKVTVSSNNKCHIDKQLKMVTGLSKFEVLVIVQGQYSLDEKGELAPILEGQLTQEGLVTIERNFGFLKCLRISTHSNLDNFVHKFRSKFPDTTIVYLGPEQEIFPIKE